MSNDIVSILTSQGMSFEDIANMFGVSVNELESSCNGIASEALEKEVVQEQHVESIQASKLEEAAKAKMEEAKKEEAPKEESKIVQKL